jgi:membrane-bound lytic murein transglycosylase D
MTMPTTPELKRWERCHRLLAGAFHPLACAFLLVGHAWAQQMPAQATQATTRLALIDSASLSVTAGVTTIPPVSPVTPGATASEPASEAIPVATNPTSAEQPATTEPIAPTAPVSLWDRIRSGFAVPDLTGKLVQSKEKFYADKPELVQRISLRASRYLFQIVEEVERRGMPMEVALLPFIESAFNPMAASPAKAMGLWQFIPGTGRDYGLRQTMFQDERRDVLESTRAALDYLGKLHDMFGDWHLAFAAYNWGEGAVTRAIEYNRKRGLPTDYESLRMPNETRHYVPSLQAVKNIVAQPDRFDISLPPIDNENSFVTVSKSRDIDVHVAAKFAGMSLEDFTALNPSFSKPVIPGSSQTQIILPRERAAQFEAALESATGPLSSYTTYQLKPGETVDKVAPRFHASADQIRSINNIPRNAKLKTGCTILVPRPVQHTDDIPGAVAENAVLAWDQPRAAKRKVNAPAKAKSKSAQIHTAPRKTASGVASSKS